MGKPRSTGLGGIGGGNRQGFVKTLTVFNDKIEPTENGYIRVKGREYGRWIEWLNKHGLARANAR